MRDVYIKSKAGMFPIGRRGENLATRVIYPGVPEEGQAVTVFIKRNGDSVAYPASQVEVTDAEIIWIVTSVDTDKQGRGQVQYRYTNSETGEIIKTDIYAFMVGLAIDVDPGEAPDPYETWVDSLVEAAGQTQTYATQAKASAESAEASANEIEGMTAEATTLPAGSEATASYSNGVLSLGIPRGADGQGGGGDITAEAIEEALGYTPASDAVATFTSNGLMSAVDYQYLNADIPRRLVPRLGGVDGHVLKYNDSVSPAPFVWGEESFNAEYKNKVDTLWDDYSDALEALG